MTTQLPITSLIESEVADFFAGFVEIHTELGGPNTVEEAQTELTERICAILAAYEQEPFGFVTKRCAEHMHDDDSDELNWMWSISAVVIGCNPKLKHEVPVYLRPAPSIPAVPDEVMRCLGFFASVIKSRESWTSVCQHEYDTAKEACRAAMLNGGKL